MGQNPTIWPGFNQLNLAFFSDSALVDAHFCSTATKTCVIIRVAPPALGDGDEHTHTPLSGPLFAQCVTLLAAGSWRWARGVGAAAVPSWQSKVRCRRGTNTQTETEKARQKHSFSTRTHSDRDRHLIQKYRNSQSAERKRSKESQREKEHV
jgi:hypothetical protein